jgi:hypothetical protein
MVTEIQQQPVSFRQRIREVLQTESARIVPVTEFNFSHLEPLLSHLSELSHMDQMVDGSSSVAAPTRGTESMMDWVKSTHDLWIIAPKDVIRIENPEHALGFVSVYTPEHLEDINAWLAARHKKPYAPEEIFELSSFAKKGEETAEQSASKIALSKVFLFDPAYKVNDKDVQAVSVWVTHNSDNVLDPKDAESVKQLGGFALGTKKYAEGEPVDSTCFIIPRQGFFNALTGDKRPTLRSPRPPQV